nr:helix-turn-helix transcriptional regulator [Streptomyces sp. FR1]
MPKARKFGMTATGPEMPQPEKQLKPEESPQDWFGSELRHRRKEHGLSARALGRLAQVSDDMILMIEKAKYPSLQREVAQQFDKVLDTGGVFDRAWPMAFGKGVPKETTLMPINAPRAGRRERFRCTQAASWAETMYLLALGAMSPCTDGDSSKAA